MKIIVDKEACVSCELCVTTCPELFTMDENNKAVVIAEPVSLKDETCAKAAELRCPVNAITVQ
jgi:ferredoxin